MKSSWKWNKERYLNTCLRTSAVIRAKTARFETFILLWRAVEAKLVKESVDQVCRFCSELCILPDISTLSQCKKVLSSFERLLLQKAPYEAPYKARVLRLSFFTMKRLINRNLIWLLLTR